MDDLDEVDRACAIAQGWKAIPAERGGGAPLYEDLHGEEHLTPCSPTRVPADHIALLKWLRTQDTDPLICESDGENEHDWYASVYGAPHNYFAEDACPMVALARATAKWAAGRGK